MKFLYYIIFLFIFSPVLFAQEMNVDEIITRAKREVEKGNYDTALSLIEPLNAKFPENEDISLYRTHLQLEKRLQYFHKNFNAYDRQD